MCPCSKSPVVVHDSDETPEGRVAYHKSSRRPTWYQKAHADAGKNRTFRSTVQTNMADSIIGNINLDADVRIIFLDIDGVINHPNSCNDEGTTICPDCVNKLKSMLAHTSAKIVLSSTWRLNKRHKKTLFRHLRAIEIDQGVVVGETRDLRKDRKNRAEEINDWLSHPKLYKKKDITSLHSWQVQTWVSLDDLDLASMQPNNHVKSKHIKLDPKLGLCGTESIVTNVVQKLSKRMGQTLNDLSRTISDSMCAQSLGGLTARDLSYSTRSRELVTPDSCVKLPGTQRNYKSMPWFDEANHLKTLSTGYSLSHEGLQELREAPESSKESGDSLI